MIKQLNQQVDLKLLIKTVSGVAVLALLLCIGYFGYKEIQKTIWYKRFILWHYLKKNSINKNFVANYDFDIKSTIDKIKGEIAATTNQIYLTTTNITQLQKQLSDLRREHDQIQNKIGSLRSRASSLEDELQSNQRRLTNQLTEIETARSNFNFRLKVVDDLKGQIKALQEKYTALTNEIAIAKTNLAVKQSLLKMDREALAFGLKLKSKSSQDKSNVANKEKLISDIDSQIVKNQKDIDDLLKQKTAATDAKIVQEIDGKIAALKDYNEKLQKDKAMLSDEKIGMETVVAIAEKIVNDRDKLIANLQSTVEENQKLVDSLAKTISQKENEAADLRRQISSLSSTLSDREGSLKSYKNNLSQLETNLFIRQTNIAFLKTNALEKRREALNAGKALAENEKMQASIRDEIQKNNDKLNELRKKLTALQRELSQKEAEAANQYRYFARDVASKINGASSYAAIYHIIGQQLWVAERLMKAVELEKRVEAVKIAFDAMRYALDPAQNYWLAARIAEVYLFPNINLLKGNDADKQLIDQIFNYAVNAFQNNEEDENVIRAYELHLANTVDERRANTVRYYLSLQHEQKGDLEKAVYYLKQITDKTNFAYAVNRIPNLEARLENLKKKK